jgi:DNA-binding NtrC family response regulator
LPERLVGLRERVRQRHRLEHLPEETPTLRRVAEQARLAAQTRTPVLLVGEPGVGKRWLARAIHDLGSSVEQPFVGLDCARLPSAAIAAVLFGDGSPGPGVAAGTIYLAEPTALPRDLQLRLVGVLDVVGETRFIAGTSAPDLGQEVRSGRLLETLASALQTLVIPIPPLHERAAELPRLVEVLLQRAQGEGEAPTGLTPEAWRALRQYRWPGNLRELYRVLQTSGRQARGAAIDLADLPASLRLLVRLGQSADTPAEQPLALDKVLEEAERRLIGQALRKARGNKSKAAELLSIWRQRLVRRMEALGIADPESPE